MSFTYSHFYIRYSKMASLTKDQIKEAFQLFDSDSDGQLDVDEVFYAMKGLGFDDMTRDEVQRIFEKYRGDNKSASRISFESFENAVYARMPEPGSREELQKAFSLFDLNKTGQITAETLRQVAKQLNEDPSDETLEDMIKAADLDGDGVVSFEDFESVMTSLRNK